MRNLNYLWLVLVALLSACSTLEAPKTFQERMLYTQYGLVAVVEIATDLRERGKLSPEEIDSVADVVVQADVALKTARSLSFQGKPENALQYLETANGLLRQLEAYLKGKA